MGTAYAFLQIPLPPGCAQVTYLDPGQRLSPGVMLALLPHLHLLPLPPGLAALSFPNPALRFPGPKGCGDAINPSDPRSQTEPPERTGVCGSLFYMHYTHPRTETEIHTTTRMTPAQGHSHA